MLGSRIVKRAARLTEHTTQGASMRRAQGGPETPVRLYVVTTAQSAECTCPEFCERDHDRD
jgi:hypothetical protein